MTDLSEYRLSQLDNKLIFNGHLHPSDIEALSKHQSVMKDNFILKESCVLTDQLNSYLTDRWWQSNVDFWQKYIRAVQHSDFYSWPLKIVQACWRLCRKISSEEYARIQYFLQFGEESLILDLAHKLRDAGIPEAKHLLTEQQAEWVLTTLADVPDDRIRMNLMPTLYGSGYVLPLQVDRYILLQGDCLVLAKDPRGAQIINKSSLGFHRGLSLGMSFPERYVRYSIAYTYLVEACGSDVECRRLLMTNIYPCFQMCACICGDVCESDRYGDDYVAFQKFVERSVSITTTDYPVADIDTFGTIRISTGNINECFGVLRTNALNWIECISRVEVPENIGYTDKYWDRCVRVYIIPNMFMSPIDRCYLLERLAIFALNISGIILSKPKTSEINEDFCTYLERLMHEELICLNDVSHQTMKYKPVPINFTSHTLAEIECALMAIVSLHQQSEFSNS